MQRETTKAARTVAACVGLKGRHAARVAPRRVGLACPAQVKTAGPVVVRPGMIRSGVRQPGAARTHSTHERQVSGKVPKGNSEPKSASSCPLSPSATGSGHLDLRQSPVVSMGVVPTALRRGGLVRAADSALALCGGGTQQAVGDDKAHQKNAAQRGRSVELPLPIHRAGVLGQRDELGPRLAKINGVSQSGALQLSTSTHPLFTSGAASAARPARRAASRARKSAGCRR